MEESITFAKEYLENLLSFFGLNIDVAASYEEDVILLDVPSTHLNGFLIGSNADTLRSFQSLLSIGLLNSNYPYHRVNLDIANYKKQRQRQLKRRALVWIEEVKRTKQPKKLEPMNAADRRLIHRLATDYNLKSQSEGQGRDRRVVLQLGPEENLN